MGTTLKAYVYQSVRTVFMLSVPFLFLGNRMAHDFHTSITQMTYSPKDKAFEISVRVFTDDFEKALSKDNNGQRIQLVNNDKNDPLIEKYIRKHFSMTNAQKQKKSFDYVGHETESDAQWIYLEMPYAEAFKGGQMQQDVLMDLFDDQVNLVNFQYLSQKKTFVFRTKQPVQEITL